eukprot:GILI01009061.1.p1 GENE.GILI01009061.1~~GILI01009061.1.p1  ORF type:complete len:654 (+),score=212.74 GILI01009061.1:99-2060(+)
MQSSTAPSTAPLPRGNMKEICKRKLIEEMIGSVRKPDQFIVMVVDPSTLKVISSVARMFDIMEQGVTVVESLTKERESLPKLEALYFVSPEDSSFDKIIADFKDAKKPKYKSAHIFCSSRIPDELFNKISRSPNLVAKVKTLKEINLDFIVHETNVFHFDLPSALPVCFTRQPQYLNMLDLMAEKLVTLCGTLGEFPYIRFSVNHELTRLLAARVKDQLETYYRSTSTTSFHPNRATLLILDRSVDPLTPVMHEVTYQSMVYDLLAIENDTFDYKYTSNAGKEETSKALLSENDELWRRLRHQHIAAVLESIVAEFNQFIRENAGSRLQRGEIRDLSEMGAAIRALPQFTELLSKYNLHMFMTDQCMHAFTSRNIMRIAELEQELATGVDKEGNAVPTFKQSSSVAGALMENFNMEDKLRLLLAFIMSMEGLREQDRRTIMESAGIPIDKQRIIQNLHFLGVSPQVSSSGPKRKVNKESIKKVQQRMREVPYELCRSVPLTRDIASSILSNPEGTQDLYPFVEPPFEYRDADFAALSAASTAVGKSVRKKKHDWGATTQDAAESSNPRFIIFHLGGMTFSEIKATYDLSSEFRRDVIIGSSHILTPRKFIDQLAEMTPASEIHSFSIEAPAPASRRPVGGGGAGGNRLKFDSF